MATDGDKNNKPSRSTSTHSTSYGLRSRVKSVSSPDPRNDVFLTPTKQNIKPSITITPSTPSSKICAICRGVDELRNYKLREAIDEFSTKIDAYKELTKSLNDNNSTLNHALDTVKHYILHIEPKQVNDSLHKIDDNLSTVKDKVDSLHEDYVSKLTSIEEFINKRVLVTTPQVDSHNTLMDRIHNLESLCTQLATKMDTLSQTIATQYSGLSLNTFTAKPSHNIVTRNVETNNANNRISNISTPHVTQRQNNEGNHNSYASTLDVTHRISPSSCLILGDSNTKYIKLPNIDVTRITTYTISDIDPYVCTGYNRIWIHVGINSLKSHTCHNTQDVEAQFRLFQSKLDTIKSLCPLANVVVSPVLPTGSRFLNARAITFNRLLFSHKNRFNLLNFNSFCGWDGRLMNIHRCFNNPHDYIHLGSKGIKTLTAKVVMALTHTDIRSYASVLSSQLTR